jgi:hypothetical protein
MNPALYGCEIVTHKAMFLAHDNKIAAVHRCEYRTRNKIAISDKYPA